MVELTWHLLKFEFQSMSEAWSVLHQTAIGLAVAEKALELEHRDLHWGNVLVRRTEEQFIKSILDGRRKVVESHGVHVSIIIIDFTLSRIKKGNIEIIHVENENRDKHGLFLYSAIFEKNIFVHSLIFLFFVMLLYIK